MMKTSVFVTMFVAMIAMMFARTASAGGQEGSIGVGAEAQLSGLGGASMSYDGGKFHAGGFFGYNRVNVTQGMNTVSESVVELGGRFYYHVHSTAMADFGVGAGLSLANVPTTNNNRNELLFLEPGFQIRLFIASNVALSMAGGIALGVIDADTVGIGGQIIGGNAIQAGGLTLGLVGGAGIHYYFF